MVILFKVLDSLIFFDLGCHALRNVDQIKLYFSPLELGLSVSRKSNFLGLNLLKSFSTCNIFYTKAEILNMEI